MKEHGQYFCCAVCPTIKIQTGAYPSLLSCFEFVWQMVILSLTWAAFPPHLSLTHLSLLSLFYSCTDKSTTQLRLFQHHLQQKEILWPQVWSSHVSWSSDCLSTFPTWTQLTLQGIAILSQWGATPLAKALSLILQLYLFNSLLDSRVFSQQEAPWDGAKYLFLGGTGRMYTHYSDASEFLVLSMMAACESTFHQNRHAISSVPSKCIFFTDVIQFLIQCVTATSLKWLCHGSELHNLSLDEGA